MRRIPITLLIALLSLLHTAGAAEKTDCQLHRYASIDFTMPNNTILIPVTIADTPALMSLGFHSSISVLWESVVRRLGIKTQPVGNNQIYYGAHRVTEYAQVPSYSLGQLKFKGAQFLVAVPPQGWESPSDPIPIVGMIGMDFFAKMDFEIDFRNHQLNLYAQDHCPGSVVYWTDTFTAVPLHRGPLGNVYFPMELDGKKIQASLGGHPGTTLTTDVTKRLYGFDENSSGIETSQEPGAQTRSTYRAMALTAPGMEVRNARVQLLPHPGKCTLTTGFGRGAVAQYTDCMGLEAPLSLGMDVIKHLHLYFATKENVVYISDVDAQKPAPAQPDAKAR